MSKRSTIHREAL